MCKAEEDSSGLNVVCPKGTPPTHHLNNNGGSNSRRSDCKYEHLIKTGDSNSGSNCTNNFLLSESRKRNKYRMLGTDLKRKAVHLVSTQTLLFSNYVNLA